MTVADFYAAHAHDGRAVVEGTWQTPVRWVVCLRAGVGVGYFLCGEDVTDAVVRLDPELPADALPRLSLAENGRARVASDGHNRRNGPGTSRPAQRLQALRAAGRCVACRRPWGGPEWRCLDCRSTAAERRAAVPRLIRTGGGPGVAGMVH